MQALIPKAEADPEGWLNNILSRAEHKETLCGDGTMVWHIWGEGTPVVLLHGGHGAWNHWCRNVEQLAASGFQVFAADLPGLGMSYDPGPPYTADGIAKIVYYGITRLVHENDAVHIVGFSFGSVIGAVVAEMLETQLGSFNVVGAAGFGPRERIRDSMIRIHDGLSQEEKLVAAKNNMEWLMLADPKNVGKLATFMQLQNSSRARTLSRPISMTVRLLEALPNILAPLNALWGELDRTTMGSLESRITMLKEERPDANIDVFDGVGHWTQFEVADRFNDWLIDKIN